MAADVTLAKGTRVYFSTDSGSTYTELTDMQSCSPPGSPKRKRIEVPSLNPTDDIRESKPGLRDPGQFTFKQYHTPARETAMQAQEGNTLKWKVTLPSGSPAKTVFNAYIEDVHEEGTDDPEHPLLLCVGTQLIDKPVYTA